MNVLDINGGRLREHGMAMLLCEVIDIQRDQVIVRPMNSEMELAIGIHHDEVLGGMIADSELTAFEPLPGGEHHDAAAPQEPLMSTFE